MVPAACDNPAPAAVLDVGGGPGVYASWLARLGYQVRLVDPVPLHVEQARAAAGAQPDHPFDALVGDARRLGQSSHLLAVARRRG